MCRFLYRNYGQQLLHLKEIDKKYFKLCQQTITLGSKTPFFLNIFISSDLFMSVFPAFTGTKFHLKINAYAKENSLN